MSEEKYTPPSVLLLLFAFRRSRPKAFLVHAIALGSHPKAYLFQPANFKQSSLHFVALLQFCSDSVHSGASFASSCGQTRTDPLFLFTITLTLAKRMPLGCSGTGRDQSNPVPVREQALLLWQQPRQVTRRSNGRFCITSPQQIEGVACVEASSKTEVLIPTSTRLLLIQTFRP
jgi:hypothetical protein